MDIQRVEKLEVIESNKVPFSNKNHKFLWLGGIGFTFIVALFGYALAKVPGFQLVGPLACAILISIGYRQLAGYPELLREGIQFTSKKLLRFAIILYGLKLNMSIVFQDGLGLLVRDLGTVVFSILVTVILAKFLKANRMISLLLGVGTGVCGAAAIAAVAPIVKADEEDTAISVGIIALVGTIFAVVYTMVRPFLPISDSQYGMWSGISLHEIAHVALAAAPAGADALAIALLAKLGRVFLLVPLCFIFMFFMKQRTNDNQSENKVEFPWFLIGFILMSLVGTNVFGSFIKVSDALLDHVSFGSTFILTMAMVGLGLNVSFHTLRTKALKPLVAMIITSLLLVVVTFFTL